MKRITLPCYGIVVDVGDGCGNIQSELHETDCDSDRDSLDHELSAYYGAMDGIESMIMAHAIAGVDIETPAYIEGIETAVQGCANNL